MEAPSVDQHINKVIPISFAPFVRQNFINDTQELISQITIFFLKIPARSSFVSALEVAKLLT